MATTSAPLSPELRARIQTALDYGLSQQDFVELVEYGRVTSSNVGRALRGISVSTRTARSLARCCAAFERRHGEPKPLEALFDEVDDLEDTNPRLEVILDILAAWARNPGQDAALCHMVAKGLGSAPLGAGVQRRLRAIEATVRAHDG